MKWSISLMIAVRCCLKTIRESKFKVARTNMVCILKYFLISGIHNIVNDIFALLECYKA